MLSFYSGSVMNALFDVFPDIGLQRDEFPVPPGMFPSSLPLPSPPRSSPITPPLPYTSSSRALGRPNQPKGVF